MMEARTSFAHRPAFTAFWRGRRSSASPLWTRLFPLLLLLAALPGSAQFSGPPVGMNTDVNRKLPLTTDPAILYPGPRDVRLERGDLLAVRIFGANPSTDYSPSVRISLDGTIRLPLIGLVQLSGLTLHEAESLIAARLVADGMYVDPQVSLQLTESPEDVVTLTGEMHGVFPTIGSKRLLDVLSAGGGLPITASHVITIDRPGLDEPIILDLGTDPAHSARADVPVFPHDTIVVSRVGVVYMLGAFRTPGSIPLQKNSPLTLLQAVALSGGTIHEGKNNDLRIIRTEGNSRSVVRVDIKKVQYGHSADPILQADDVVYLPPDPFKVITTAAGIGTLLGIVSLLIFAAQSGL